MVGAHLSFLYKDEEERGKFLSVITDAEWGIQLGKLGVSAELMQSISSFSSFKTKACICWECVKSFNNLF